VRSALVRLGLLLSVTAAGLVVAPSSAMALSEDPDTTPWMANGKIHASAQYGNVLFIGGSFTKLRQSLPPGPASGPQVSGLTGLAAIDMTTGAGIASFTPDLGTTGKQVLDVRALAVVGNDLYAGGQFSSVDGTSHYNLARIHIDPATVVGTVDNTFDPTVGIPGASAEASFAVNTILPGPDAIYIGGAFSQVNGRSRVKTAKLGFDGTLDSRFKTPGTNAAVMDMAWSADRQTIFVSGAFSMFGNAARQSIARIDPATGAVSAWTIPVGQIPVGGSSDPGQTCWELEVIASRLFAGCGRGPNFVGAFRLDTGDTGGRTWQYGTTGNVQAIRLLPNGQDLVIGGHLGINSTSTFNGLMHVCSNTKYLRTIAILRNVAAPSGTGSVVTSGATSSTTPWLDCSFLPNVDGTTPAGPNFSGTNRYGGIWEIQVTGQYLWGLGEFKHINTAPRRAIARWTW
jgi:hypothetical protein